MREDDEYLARKLEEAKSDLRFNVSYRKEQKRLARDKHSEARRAAQQNKREANRIARANEKEAKRVAREKEEERRANLSPEEREVEDRNAAMLRAFKSKEGALALSGSILNWTQGYSPASITSRYQQACRLRPSKLTLDETIEAINVVHELIFLLSIPNYESLVEGVGNDLELLHYRIAFAYKVKELTYKNAEKMGGIPIYSEDKRIQKKLEKLEVVLLELSQHRDRRREAILAAEAAASDVEDKLHKSAKSNNSLADRLLKGINSAKVETACGFVYLKQWTVPGGPRWLKVGVTNNPDRRDAEQNVLPVPAVTLRMMRVQNMEQALAIERRIHRELSDKRIEGANNRELFQLSDSDLAALMLAME